MLSLSKIICGNLSISSSDSFSPGWDGENIAAYVADTAATAPLVVQKLGEKEEKNCHVFGKKEGLVGSREQSLIWCLKFGLRLLLKFEIKR
jgi:hypothetical protein